MTPMSIAMTLRAVRPRSLLRQIHLWLGLGLGVLFALLGLTGSALVFYVEIDRALNLPATTQVALAVPGWESPIWDRALDIGRKQWPERGGDWSFEVTGERGLVHARYYPPSGHHEHHAEREMVWFAADGGSVVRTATWGDYLMSWLYELHMHLLAGDLGSQIVGWSGFVLLVLLISGVATWWPRGSWRKALAIKRHAVPQRRLRDLHKHFGLWSAGLLLLLGLTGALLALPDIKTQVFAATIARPDAVPAPQSTRSSGVQISVNEALKAAHRALPDSRLAFIDVPDGGAAPIKVRVQVPGDPHRRFPRSMIFIDQYSGTVLAVHDVRRGNAGNATETWIRPIHDGSIAGLPTRILAVLIGLAPTALLITGFLHWRRRRMARLRAPTLQHHSTRSKI
jgi:uncharacterized iron-regulated membrane protein